HPRTGPAQHGKEAGVRGHGNCSAAQAQYPVAGNYPAAWLCLSRGTAAGMAKSEPSRRLSHYQSQPFLLLPVDWRPRRPPCRRVTGAALRRSRPSAHAEIPIAIDGRGGHKLVLALPGILVVRNLCPGTLCPGIVTLRYSPERFTRTTVILAKPSSKAGGRSLAAIRCTTSSLTWRSRLRLRSRQTSSGTSKNTAWTS